ncbi:uncharacterized protein [Argopecten irradians]|uniref:uncharacterized protein n=1 Tax=Argopecten irradians TaxID=31199 RepID=UPI00370FCAF1
MMSLKKELTINQQVAIESLQQNGCEIQDIKKAISIFRNNNGHDDYNGEALMKIIFTFPYVHEESNEIHVQPREEDPSDINDTKDDKTTNGPLSASDIKEGSCHFCQRTTRPLSPAIVCDRCKDICITQQDGAKPCTTKA